MNVIHSVLAFVVALGVLVAVHEYGHFWVARRLGVKILRFSLGFGRPLWTRRCGPDATEFTVAVLPLGGYVKMLDEREGEVAPGEAHRAFNRQSLGYRSAIVAAGPIANFAFAIIAYWVMFLVGVDGVAPIVGAVREGTVAQRTGLEAGDRIITVNGRATPTWEAVLHETMKRVLDHERMRVQVDGRAGRREVELDLGDVRVDDVTRGNFFDKLGLEPVRAKLSPRIGEIVSGGRAQAAGLAVGDLVVAVDGRPMGDWSDWVRYVRAHPEQRMEVEILRQNRRERLVLVPERHLECPRAGLAAWFGAAPACAPAEHSIGRIGAGVDQDQEIQAPPVATERYGPLRAMVRAGEKTWDTSALTLGILGKMLFGEASVRNLSGPISIAQYAGQSASIGFAAFLAFLAIVSVSLGVLNLLPVPLLDGGHLMYYLIELVTRRPVAESLQVFGQQIGLVLLLGLMGLAFYNDLMRLL